MLIRILTAAYRLILGEVARHEERNAIPSLLPPFSLSPLYPCPRPLAYILLKLINNII
jgi:hypothetical protein